MEIGVRRTLHSARPAIVRGNLVVRNLEATEPVRYNKDPL